jgi:sigma-B regulation protein RsbQ
LEAEKIIFVGHSVSAMMGAVAAKEAPALFKALVMVSPSPSFINDGDYNGGFTQPQINELLETLDNNHMGWSMTMAPVIMGKENGEELVEELSGSFCRINPEIAKQFARVTFLEDTRPVLKDVPVHSLILQCKYDAIAPVAVGEYVQAQMPDSQLVVLDTIGHCPHLSAPELTVAAVKAFL